MTSRWLRVCGWGVLFAGGLVGYGTGRTCASEGGFDIRGISTGLWFAAGLTSPIVGIGAVAGITGWWARRGWRPYHRGPGRCPQCDYQLPDRRGTHTCPECGTTSDEPGREPLSSEALSADAIGWLTKRLVAVVIGAVIAQALVSLEERATWLNAPRAFAAAAKPNETDSHAPTIGYWTPKPMQSCQTPYGWVDWHGPKGRVFRPRRWTPWPHWGTLLFLDWPSFSRGPRLFYYGD